jgi:hypothetical protein
MRFLVISTAYRPPLEAKEKCLRSVREQASVVVDHVYVDAAIMQTPPRRATENLYESIRYHWRGHDVIALVDGDDWLTASYALARVAREYEDPECCLTYGSYRFADGRPGHAAKYGTLESVRRSPWRATHLKTFRVGLGLQLRHEWLQDLTGQWLERCVDMATMFPLMELAGLDRCRFIPDVLYTYNLASSWEWSATPVERAEEIRVESYLRRRKPLERLESL